jgi:4-hydroxybenzoate polyprenyltransferase
MTDDPARLAPDADARADTHGDAAPADAVRGTWVERAPAWTRPWLRLMRADRPVGVWLLLFPCWWGVALATAAGAPGREFVWRLPDVWLLALFAIGAIAMRGAGCTFNDIVDRDIDAQVERTRARPLAAGTVGVFGALVFLALLCLIGLAVLLAFDRFTIYLGLVSLLLVAIYPFMKRVTHWPQLVLGLAFNWGALMGWSAAHGGALGLAPVLLYLGGVAWTIGYDTIYAHQDKQDDAIVGVKSTALLFGARTRLAVAGFYAGALLFWALAIGLAAPWWPAWAGLAAAALHMAWQVATLDTADPANCLARFRANVAVGWALLVGLLAAALLAP